MIREFFQSLNYRNFIFMKQLIDRTYRIIFLFLGLCLLASCATTKPEESLELHHDQPQLEALEKNPIPKSAALKISSIDELIDYLGIVPPQEDEFRSTYASYTDDKKQIIRSSSDTAQVKSSLQDRKAQFLDSLHPLMSTEQYSRFISYLHQNDQQKQGKENF